MDYTAPTRATKAEAVQKRKAHRIYRICRVVNRVLPLWQIDKRRQKEAWQNAVAMRLVAVEVVGDTYIIHSY